MAFRLEEATIDELHRAIKAGETTCVAVVEQYIARARAHNRAPPRVAAESRTLPAAAKRPAHLAPTGAPTPPLDEMPMYGVVFSFKDPFDTKDMRPTAGGDAAYDIDFPARDHILVEQLRNKGAIIFAKAVCTEYNGRAGNPGGRHAPEQVLPSTLRYQRSSWAGNPAN